MKTVPDTFHVTLALVILGLVWRIVRYAMAFPLWGDEAFLAVNFLTRDFSSLGSPLEFGQVAPPGFLWAELGVARVLGTSERALRLVPFLAGLASLGLFWRFSREAASPRVTLLAVALFAASFFPVRHATEVKPYATDLLVSLAITSLGWSVWQTPKSVRRWLALAAAGVAGVWCSYTAVFPVGSVGLVLIVRGWRARSIRLTAPGLAFALASGASWAAMIVTFAGPQLGESSWLRSMWSDGFPPLSNPWRLPLWLIEAHTGGLTAYPFGGRSFTGIPIVLLVTIGAIAAWRRGHRDLVAMLLGPLPLALLAATFRRYPYGTSTRLMLYMAPALCLLAGEGIVALLRNWGHLRRGPIIVAGLLGVIPLVGTVCDVCMPYRRHDDLEYRRFVERLAAQTSPGDRWIIFDGADPLPVYPELMASIWVQRVAKLRFYLLSLAPVPARMESDPRNVGPNPDGRTWLIIHDHGCRPLYPHELGASFEPIVHTRLGPPRSTKHALPTGSTVDVHVFATKGSGTVLKR